jgi:hypothetical protein
MPDRTYEEGPVGGGGGRPFCDAIVFPSQASLIIVRHADEIDALQMVLQTHDGLLHYLGSDGGPGGAEDVFTLDAGEYLIGISGKYGDRIDTIRFITNMKTSQDFGGSGGHTDFAFTATQGYQIVGFFGRSGDRVDAVGVIYALL